MQHLHADGVRTFDFAMGDYAYKRRFGAERLPLITVEIALTARAMPGATARYLYRRLAAAPQMRHLREWWRGRRPASPAATDHFTQLALRFSKNAETPSIASGFSQVSARRRMVSSIT